MYSNIDVQCSRSKKEIIKVDVEHNGTLDFDEFFDLMTSLMTDWNPEQDLGRAQTKQIYPTLSLRLFDLVAPQVMITHEN